MQSTAPYKSPPLVPKAPANIAISVNTSTQILPTNLNRKTVVISNPTSGLGAATMYVSFATPAVANKGVAIGPGSNWTLYRAPTDPIFAIIPGLIGSMTMCLQEFE